MSRNSCGASCCMCCPAASIAFATMGCWPTERAPPACTRSRVAAPGGQRSLGCRNRVQRRLNDLLLPALRPSHDCSGNLHARPGNPSAGSTAMTAPPSHSPHHALALRLPMPMRARLALDLQNPSPYPSANYAARGAGPDPRPLAAALSPLISSLVTSSARTEVRIAIGSCRTELLR
jgi:hypothetical protein